MTRVAIPPNSTPTASRPSNSASAPVDILILGAGWTSTFLIPLLKSCSLTYAATTRAGHDGTIPFTFDPTSDSEEPYTRLPRAKTILITFPLKGQGEARLLTALYAQTHDGAATGQTRWIQLGSTGIFKGPGWNDSTSPYDTDNPRAIAEDELLALLAKRACVLNLAGLYGGERQPRNWLPRVAKSKSDVAGKGALHLIHGRDVARAIIAAHEHFAKVGGKRWILTDLHAYDWWDLFLSWGHYARGKAHASLPDGESGGDTLVYERWVLELMEEQGVRALPREKEGLGRLVDGREFWHAVGAWPEEGRVQSASL